MSIAKNSVVSLSYKMLNSAGEVLDETATDTPMVYLHGGYDGIFPLVEEALHGKSIGDTIDVLMDEENAFGPHDDNLVRVENRELFPEDVSVGMMFEADDVETGEVMIFTVTNLTEDEVHVDGNHPLAGQSIRFIATVQAVREATAEEIAHEHVHGDGGHHH